MRILITSIVDLRKTSHNRLHQFIMHVSRNHIITVLSINDWWKTSQTDVSQYQMGVEDMLRGVDIKYFTTRKLSPYLQEVFSFVTLNRILKEIDYTKFDVHLNYNTLISGYLVAKKLKSAGINTVYDIADDLPQMIRNSPQIPSALRLLGGLVGTAMVSRNMKISRKVACITDSLRDSYHIPQDKFELIPNGVDTGLFKSYPSEQLRQSLGIGTGFVVGYVGVLREWVDFEPVFAAIKQIDQDKHNMKVLIVGEEGGITKVENLAKKYQVLDRVIFTGTVPYTKVPEYISCMDVCVVPFKEIKMADDAIPLKLFEYMACRRPVISTRTMSAVQDRIIYAPNAKEYENRIGELYRNSNLRVKLGTEGRKFVEQNHSWEKLVQRLERVLMEAAS